MHEYFTNNVHKIYPTLSADFSKFRQIFSENSPKFWQVCPKFSTNFSKNTRDFLFINIIVKILFLLRVLYIPIVRKLTNNFLQIFQNFLWKNFKILLYLLYFNLKIFVYFIQNLSRQYEKFTFIFYKLKNFPRVFFEFLWISPISLQFPEIFPTIYLKLQVFQNIFLKFSLLKFV